MSKLVRMFHFNSVIKNKQKPTDTLQLDVNLLHKKIERLNVR